MYHAAVLLDRVRKEVGEDRFDINWKHFSLEQVNSKEGPEWKAWEQPEGATRSMLAARAGEAARLQGREAFERFHMALLTARHGGDRADLRDREVIIGVARQAGLDVERFARDLDNREFLKKVGEDHTKAVEQYGIFGTPTFVFPSGGVAYLKMVQTPEGQAAKTWDTLVDMMEGRLFVGEVKRPQPPWPRGVAS